MICRARSIPDPCHSICPCDNFLHVSSAYPICVAEDIEIEENGFCTASTVEHFMMPSDVIAVVHDNSTWARQGMPSFITIIEAELKVYPRDPSPEMSQTHDGIASRRP